MLGPWQGEELRYIHQKNIYHNRATYLGPLQTKNTHKPTRINSENFMQNSIQIIKINLQNNWHTIMEKAKITACFTSKDSEAPY